MAFEVPSGIANLIGLDSGSSWEDRLREAAYISPSGTRIIFQYANVQRTGTKRGTVFEFPGVDGGFVQQKGRGPRRYPLVCFFSGADHDKIALAFEAAIDEDGIGSLDHPMYGKVPVVPFGDWTRRDDLVTAANQSVVQVTFWKTLKQIYPTAVGSPRNEILDALGDFDVEAAQAFEANMGLLNAADRENAIASIREGLRAVSAALRDVSDATASVRREFDQTFDLINFGLDVLIGQPLLLALQISNLIKAPARALAGIQSRLDAYAALADIIFGSDMANPSGAPSVTTTQLTKRSNDVVISDLFLMNSVGGSVLSTVNNQFATKPEAIAAADEVSQQLDDVVEWRDDANAEIGLIDTGGAYQQLQRSVAVTEGFLIEISFQLVPERRVVLDRPRTIIDLAGELYGSVDDNLDLLISSNNLTGSEILELPRGKLIAYYPTT